MSAADVGHALDRLRVIYPGETASRRHDRLLSGDFPAEVLEALPRNGNGNGRGKARMIAGAVVFGP